VKSRPSKDAKFNNSNGGYRPAAAIRKYEEFTNFANLVG